MLSVKSKIHLTSFIIFLILFNSVVFHNSVFAADIYVDIIYGYDSRSGLSWSTAKQTIRAGLALSAVRAGPDTVHVAEGLYLENIILVEDTTLLGGYPSGGGSRDIVTHMTTISATSFSSAVTGANNCVIDGFTITGGYINSDGVNPNTGAGILCDGISMIISNNIITGNALHGATSGSQPAYGGGIYCKNSHVEILRNTIKSNFAEGDDVTSGYGTAGNGYGGGIACVHSTIQVVENNILSNYVRGGDGGVAWGTAGEAYGGGIYCESCTSTISHNTISGNAATGSSGTHTGARNGYGGGLFVYGGSSGIEQNTIQNNRVYGASHDYSSGGTGADGIGGGICVVSGTSIIKQNIIEQNKAHGGNGSGVDYGWGGSAYGGGIFNSAPGTVIARNTLLENEATSGTGMYSDTMGPSIGGGIYSDGLSARIENNVIMKNKTLISVCDDMQQKGGGIHLVSGTCINNTLLENAAQKGGGASICKNVKVVNNIFDHNEGYQIYASEPPDLLANNDFYNNLSGIYTNGVIVFSNVSIMDASLSFSHSNISCAPDFLTSGYHLAETSCCRDTGSPDCAPPVDHDGDPRPLFSGYDIGADEYKPPGYVPVTRSLLTCMILILGLSLAINLMLLGK